MITEDLAAILAIRPSDCTEREGERAFTRMRWRLVPSWWPKPLKELKAATVNARAETIAEKPHVGARVRAARLEAGKSQTEVAQSLGLTFQRVQKYEKGTNRISAGRLHELSRLFDTPVQFFFDRMPGAVSRRGNSKGVALDPLTRFGGTSDGMKIVLTFEKADSALRRILAQHVEDVVRLAGREKPSARG